jgi:hypothetical protein
MKEQNMQRLKFASFSILWAQAPQPKAGGGQDLRAITTLGDVAMAHRLIAGRDIWIDINWRPQ